MKRYEKLDGSPLETDRDGEVALRDRDDDLVWIPAAALAAAGLVNEIDEVTLTLSKAAIDALWQQTNLFSIHPALFDAVDEARS